MQENKKREYPAYQTEVQRPASAVAIEDTTAIQWHYAAGNFLSAGPRQQIPVQIL